MVVNLIIKSVIPSYHVLKSTQDFLKHQFTVNISSLVILTQVIQPILLQCSCFDKELNYNRGFQNFDNDIKN